MSHGEKTTMTTAHKDTKNTGYDKEAAKQTLINEAKLGLLLAEHGINYNPEEIRPFQDSYEQSSAYNRQRGLTGYPFPAVSPPGAATAVLPPIPWSLKITSRSCMTTGHGSGQSPFTRVIL